MHPSEVYHCCHLFTCIENNPQLHHCFLVTYGILVQAVAGMAIPGKAGRTDAVGLHANYLQLKAMKLVLACHSSSDLMVCMSAN